MVIKGEFCVSLAPRGGASLATINDALALIRLIQEMQGSMAAWTVEESCLVADAVREPLPFATSAI